VPFHNPLRPIALSCYGDGAFQLADGRWRLDAALEATPFNPAPSMDASSCCVFRTIRYQLVASAGESRSKPSETRTEAAWLECLPLPSSALPIRTGEPNANLPIRELHGKLVIVGIDGLNLRVLQFAKLLDVVRLCEIFHVPAGAEDPFDRVRAALQEERHWLRLRLAVRLRRAHGHARRAREIRRLNQSQPQGRAQNATAA